MVQSTDSCPRSVREREERRVGWAPSQGGDAAVAAGDGAWQCV